MSEKGNSDEKRDKGVGKDKKKRKKRVGSTAIRNTNHAKVSE